MPTYKTRGIVLGRHNLGEADRLITFITPDRGKLRAVARGVRRIKSRQAGHLELFVETDLMLAEGRKLDVVASARLVNYYDMTKDWRNLGYAYLVAEMVSKLTDEGVAGSGLYQIVRQAYGQIGQGQADDLLELYFKLNLLVELGYLPHLDGCVVCHNQDETTQYFFNPELGGIADQTCTSLQSYPLSTDQIKLWRLVLSQPIEQVRQVARAAELAGPSLPALDSFYDYLFGRRFVSRAILAS